MMDKIITIKDGKIVDMKINDSPLPAEEIQFYDSFMPVCELFQHCRAGGDISI